MAPDVIAGSPLVFLPISTGAWNDNKGRLFPRGMEGGARGPAERRLDRDHGSTRGDVPRNVRDVEGVEARAEHGESELLDEITAAKPEADHTRYHSAEELRKAGLEHISDAVALVQNKGTAEELEEYRRFVLTLANKVAGAHREHGQSVSPAETDAIQAITAALGATAS